MSSDPGRFQQLRGDVASHADPASAPGTGSLPTAIDPDATTAFVGPSGLWRQFANMAFTVTHSQDEDEADTRPGS